MSLKNELRKNINIWQEKQFKNAEEYWDNKLKKILIDESLMGKDHFLIRVSNSVVATRLLENSR